MQINLGIIDFLVHFLGSVYNIAVSVVEFQAVGYKIKYIFGSLTKQVWGKIKFLPKNKNNS